MIRYKNYIIEPNGHGRYDVYKEVTAKKKGTKEEYLSKSFIAYALSMDRVMHYLITDAVDTKCNAGEITTLQGYIDALGEIAEDVIAAVKK